MKTNAIRLAVTILSVFFIYSANAQIKREHYYDQVYAGSDSRYLVTSSCGVEGSDALLFSDTKLLKLPAPFDTKPAHFVCSSFYIGTFKNLYDFEITLTADDLFAEPLKLDIPNTKSANTRRLAPYSLREQFRKLYPKGVTGKFIYASPEERGLPAKIYSSDSRSSDTTYFRWLLTSEIYGLHPESYVRQLITPDTTQLTAGVWGNYFSPQHSPDDVFAITLKKDGTGIFYGNTDIFDLVRENYLPGLYSVEMRDLVIDGNKISFKIELTSKDLYDHHFYLIRIPYHSAGGIIPGREDFYSTKLHGTIYDNKIVLSEEGTTLGSDLVLLKQSELRRK